MVEQQPIIKPNPDPSTLTTAALQREVHAVLQLLDARRDGVEKAITARLEAMDKALVLLQHTIDKSPTIAEIYARFDERFNGIQVQFSERDTRTEQTAREGKVSIDAALQAAKEAVSEQNKSNTLAIAKSETSTEKRIDQIIVTVNTMASGLDGKINDIKDRISTIEKNSTGQVQHSKGIADSWGLIVGLMGLIAGVIVAVVKFVK